MTLQGMVMDRVYRRVVVRYFLASHQGSSPDRMSKSFYFELPADRDTEAGWFELLHRIFYDASVESRRKEPSDTNWLALESFEVIPIDLQLMFAWSGSRDRDSIERHMPWWTARDGIVAHTYACWWVDDSGRYDGMAVDEFTELLSYRAVELGVIEATQVLALMTRIYQDPSVAARMFEDRQQRLANLTCVRPTTAFRKQPDSRPCLSGPLDTDVLGELRVKPPKSAPEAASDETDAFTPRVKPPKYAPEAASDETDEFTPGGTRKRHILVASLFLIGTIVVIVCWQLREQRQHAHQETQATQQAKLEPLVEQWRELKDQDHASRLTAFIEASSPAEASGCASLSGQNQTITVVNRAVLDALITGEDSIASGSQTFVNSGVWRQVSERRPPRSAEALQQQSARVRDELERPCVGVLTIKSKGRTRAISVQGGDVTGRLRVVCLGQSQVSCEVGIYTDSPANYWDNVDRALAQANAGIVVLH